MKSTVKNCTSFMPSDVQLKRLVLDRDEVFSALESGDCDALDNLIKSAISDTVREYFNNLVVNFRKAVISMIARAAKDHTDNRYGDLVVVFKEKDGSVVIPKLKNHYWVGESTVLEQSDF